MAVKKPTDSDSILLMIGQLLEATKAANDGLKSLGADVRSNANSIIVAAQTLEQIEEAVEQINYLVRAETNPDNLLRTSREHDTAIEDSKRGLAELKATVALMRTTVDSLNGTQVARQRGWSTAKKIAVAVIGVLAYILTQLITLWAANIQAGK